MSRVGHNFIPTHAECIAHRCSRKRAATKANRAACGLALIFSTRRRAGRVDGQGTRGGREEVMTRRFLEIHRRCVYKICSKVGSPINHWTRSSITRGFRSIPRTLALCARPPIVVASNRDPSVATLRCLCLDFQSAELPIARFQTVTDNSRARR